MLVATDLGVDVIAAGEPELDWEQVSEDAAECVRIESGRPRLGLDMDAETMPQEAGINERAVSFTKGCYVGQETVARLHYRGKPNRHLRGLRAERAGRAPDRHPARARRWWAGSAPPACRRGWARSPWRSCAARRRRATRCWWQARRPAWSSCRSRGERAPRAAGRPARAPQPQRPERRQPAARRCRARRLRFPRRRARPAARARARRGPPTCATCASWCRRPSPAARSTTGAARSASSTWSSRCSTSTTGTGSGWRPRASSTCPPRAARCSCPTTPARCRPTRR